MLAPVTERYWRMRGALSGRRRVRIRRPSCRSGLLVGLGFAERRYREHKAGPEREPSPFELTIVPNTSINGITLMGSW